MKHWRLSSMALAMLMIAADADRAFAQTHTHWLGESTGTEYTFTTPIPADFAAMLTAAGSQYRNQSSLPKYSNEVINGQSYSFVTTSVAWDNDMIDGGRIAFVRKTGVEKGDWFTMNASSNEWKTLVFLVKLQASPRRTWKYVDLIVLALPSATPPTIRLPIPEPTQARTLARSRMIELGKTTKAGGYFPSVKKDSDGVEKPTVVVPADLPAFYEQMLAYGNAGRRDPDFRKNNGSQSATNLSLNEVNTTDKGRSEKVFRQNPAPQYFAPHVLNDQLNQAAQFHAEYMASIKQITHRGPSNYKAPGSGKTVNLTEANVRAKYFGSTLSVVEAAGGGSPGDNPHDWMASDTHFRPWFNVDACYPEIGYGAAMNVDDGSWYFVAVPSLTTEAKDCSKATAPSGPTPVPTVTPITSVTPTPTASGVSFPLRAGTTIEPLRQYRSESGGHYLVFKADGNVVVYDAAHQAKWSLQSVTPNYGQANDVQVQPDGNFVVYGPNKAYIWSALPNNPDPSAYLTLAPEGALRLVSGKSGATLWASDNNLTPVSPTAGAGNVRVQPPPTPVAARPVQLENNKQYAIRQSNDTFRYFQYVYSRGERTAYFNPCPQPSSQAQTKISLPLDTTVMRVEDALAQGLFGLDQPCDVNQAPFYK